MNACHPDLPVGLWQAWSYWWQGQELKDCTFWFRQQILFWARLGKLLQYTGGAIVVMDLIGPERLARWATKFEAYRHFSNYLGAPTRNAPRSVSEGGIEKASLLIFLIVFFAVFALSAWALAHWLGDLRFTPSIFWVPVGFVAAVVYAYLLVAVVIAVHWVTHKIFIGIGLLMKIGKHYHSAQILAFLLVSIGFFFDLLGS